MIGYIVVEGPHDVAFFTAILRVHWSAILVQRISDIPPALKALIPTSFPANTNGDFTQRVDVPTFCKVGADWFVIHPAVGDGQLVSRLQRSIQEIGLDTFDAIGLVLDADSKKSPSDRFNALCIALKKKQLPTPTSLGIIDLGPPKLGVLVLPDNSSNGTLEELLLTCGQQSYPNILQASAAHVQNMTVHVQNLPEAERKEFGKSAGPNKATIATVASLLKPGKSIAASIQDNSWVTHDTLALPALKPTLDFLHNLLGPPP